MGCGLRGISELIICRGEPSPASEPGKSAKEVTIFTLRLLAKMLYLKSIQNGRGI